MQQVLGGATGNYRQMEDTGCCMKLVQHAEQHHKYVIICTLWSVMDVACVSCCLIFLLNYKKTTHRSSWVVAPFFPVASDSSYISFKTYAHFSCVPQCKHVRDAGIYWRKRNFAVLYCRGWHRRARENTSVGERLTLCLSQPESYKFCHGSTELSICLLWSGSGCGQSQCVTFRETQVMQLCPAKWRQFHWPGLSPFPLLPHYPEPPKYFQHLLLSEKMKF